MCPPKNNDFPGFFVARGDNVTQFWPMRYTFFLAKKEEAELSCIWHVSFAFHFLAPLKVYDVIDAWGWRSQLPTQEGYILRMLARKTEGAWVLDDILETCTGLPPHFLLKEKNKHLFVKPQ